MIIGNACKNANSKKDFENSKNNFNEMFKLNIDHICYVRLKIKMTVRLILTKTKITVSVKCNCISVVKFVPSKRETTVSRRRRKRTV